MVRYVIFLILSLSLHLLMYFELGLEEHEFRKAFRMNRAAFEELRLLIQPYLQKTKEQIQQAQRSSGSSISLTSKLVRIHTWPQINYFD